MAEQYSIGGSLGDRVRCHEGSARLMVFKIVIAALKTWHPRRGEKRLPKLTTSATCRSGIEAVNNAAQSYSRPDSCLL
jgi:hypothetical protein